MSFQVLEEPCWVADGCEDGRHHPGEDDAHEWHDDQDGPAAPVTQLPYRCITVKCDGLPGESCGEDLFDENENWTIHSANEQQALDSAIDEQWEITEDGRHVCYLCREVTAERAAGS